MRFFKNWKTLNNRFITFLTNRLGDIFFFFFITTFFFNFNFFFFKIINFFLILLRLTKRAQYPFSSWLPAAISAPTPVSSLVHSSTLVTAGVYIILFFSFFLNKIILKIFFFFSLLTIFFAGILGIYEKDFKKLVAFSTISQIGFLFLILSNLKIFLTFFHLFSHAFFKRLLFLRVGSILHSSNSDQETRRFFKNLNLNFFVKLNINLTSFNLIGLFFLRGFFSKDIFIINNFKIFNFFFFFIILIFLTFFYSLKIFFFFY